MTSYLLFAGLGFLIYVGLASTETATAGVGGAVFAFVSNLLAAVFLFFAYRILRQQPSSVDCVATWREQVDSAPPRGIVIDEAYLRSVLRSSASLNDRCA